MSDLFQSGSSSAVDKQARGTLEILRQQVQRAQAVIREVQEAVAGIRQTPFSLYQGSSATLTVAAGGAGIQTVTHNLNLQNDYLVIATLVDQGAGNQVTWGIGEPSTRTANQFVFSYFNHRDITANFSFDYLLVEFL